MWKYCSLELPNFEYCCLKRVCNAFQSISMGFSDSYHNLASPVSVKQNLLTFISSGKLYVSIQSFVLNRCAVLSSSALPENSGLKIRLIHLLWLWRVWLIYWIWLIWLIGGVCGFGGLGGFGGFGGFCGFC